MLNDRTVQGTHFTCFHAGPMEGWTQFRLEAPDVDRSKRHLHRRLRPPAGA